MRRSTSFIIIFFIYMLAFLIAYFTFILLKTTNTTFTIKIIICDIVATIFVWLCGEIVKNSSVYDPYWSVAPMVIIPLFVSKINIAAIILLAIIFIWGIRLTFNWAYTFKGLKHQDWRYSYFKNQFPKIWHIINFAGINLMPTLIVILVMLPTFKYLQSPKFNLISVVGIIISLIGIACEVFADMQMHSFQKQKNSQTINIGLWKYSRHPNYFGEILMWWGVFIISLSGNISFFYIIGAVANTCLFYFISIPLMEKRLINNKDNFINYQKTTSKLILLPQKKV